MQTERGTKYCSRKISKFRLTKRLFKWTDSNNLYLALSGKSASVHHIDFLLLRPKYYAILYRFIIRFVTKHPLVGERYVDSEHVLQLAQVGCESWQCLLSFNYAVHLKNLFTGSGALHSEQDWFTHGMSNIVGL